METTDHEIGETQSPSLTQDEAARLDIIRTETVLSRLPIHNLSKRGSVDIQIIKTTPDGKVELKWIVSYSDRYGQARQLAYKLDTIVINQHIDEQGRPIPKMICLGSLRDVAEELDLGGDTNKVRRALRQNASAFITAKFEYRGNDGSKKTLEADFTRYSVVFTGEQLPDGRKADAVYIILNEPYREVLNNAPIRPLDRAYMKTLSPGAQRFYEIISYKIFSALKNDYPHAKLSYSEYCTFSAQVRHYERQPVQDQMAKVLRPHKASGYISGIKYAPTIDTQNRPDWDMYIVPGPKARDEFSAVNGGKKVPRGEVGREAIGPMKHLRLGAREHRKKIDPAITPASFDPQIVAEFSRRGITEKKAQALLANLKPGQNVIAQLELGDYHISKSPGKFTNPSGFYIHLIEENTPLPDGFETTSQRNAREERERRQEEEQRHQQELERDYDDYRNAEIDQYIAAMDPAEITAVQEAKLAEMRAKHSSPWIIESFSKFEVRRELTKRVPVMSIEEFEVKRREGSATTQKPVVEAASLAEEVEELEFRGAPPVEQSLPRTDLEAAASPPVSTDELPNAITPLSEPGAPPAMFESANELVSSLPPQAPNPDPAQTEFL